MQEERCAESIFLRRFPHAEYTFSHIAKKYIRDSGEDAAAAAAAAAVNDDLWWCMSLLRPHAERRLVWFTYLGSRNVVVTMDIFGHKMYSFETRADYSPLYWGTIISGVYANATEFVCENLFWFCGKNVSRQSVLEKLELFREMFTTMMTTATAAATAAAAACRRNPPQTKFSIARIQQRMRGGGPMDSGILFLGKVNQPQTPSVVPPPPPTALHCSRRLRVFWMRASSVCDMYYLQQQPQHSSGQEESGEMAALVPDYKTSVWLNGLFRRIRENENLDFAEESDSETDFDDVRADKYVDLNKRLRIECMWHPRFKKWVPVRQQIE